MKLEGYVRTRELGASNVGPRFYSRSSSSEGKQTLRKNNLPECAPGFYKAKNRGERNGIGLHIV